MLFSRKQPKGFTYEPRYHADGTRRDQKRNIHFARAAKKVSLAKRSWLFMFCLLILVIYLFLYFRRFERNGSDATIKVEKIEVE
jgi:hypothetical protein